MSITVFLADDHAVVRDGLRLLLESEPDISVVGDAADGRETLRQVEDLCPDIAIVDITMPILNGIETTAQICYVRPSTRVVILSMHSASEHIYRALDAGALGYLLKESAGFEVVNAVRAVYGGHHYLSQKISDKLIDDYVRQRQSSDMYGRLALLSPREREVLQLVVEGRSSAEIADSLSLSQKTVETYRSRLMHKLCIDDIPGLVKFAIRHGLTPLE